MSNTDVTYVKWVEPECNSGTAASSFTTTNVGISLVFLWRAEIRIPPGHQGTTGIALVDSGSWIIPFSGATPAWLIGDDDLLEYDYQKELGENVALATYNTGRFNHKWEVRLVYTPMSAMGSEEPSIEVVTAT